MLTPAVPSSPSSAKPAASSRRRRACTRSSWVCPRHRRGVPAVAATGRPPAAVEVESLDSRPSACHDPPRNQLIPTLGCRRRSAVFDEAKFRERSEEHTSELQSRGHLVCRLLLEKKKRITSAEHDAEA